MSDFYGLEGYDLHTHPETWKPKRVVACLNVWNDRAELEATMPSWISQVDHIVAIVGPYKLIQGPVDTDGTVELLESVGAEIEVCSGYEQPLKRTRYFDHCQDGDLCVVIDADEEYVDPLPTEWPFLDVGWVRYTSPIYLRPQNTPRIFRWRSGLNYRKRHHWLYEGDKLFCTAQRGGAGYVHRRIDATFANSRGRRRAPKRQRIAEVHRLYQHKREVDAAPIRAVGHEPLRILQAAPFDPGAVCYRFHTAINTTSPHTSVLTTGCEEWTNVPRQFDHSDELVAQLSADVTHYHVNYSAPITPGKWTVIHHHGTEYRLQSDHYNEMDAKRADLRLVSNFELMQYGDDLHWLPNPMPVAEYRRLAANKPEWRKDGPLIVAHSPTKRKNKGTDVFLSAVARCRARGVDVRPHLIHKLQIRDALNIKSQSHVIFDSFWLGLQCSGLEGAAMGLPVIAGDWQCFRGYEQEIGYCPYTFANDEDTLVDTLIRLATDGEYYHAEAVKVSHYCAEYHDSANVVARYLDLLESKTDWRNVLKMGTE